MAYSFGFSWIGLIVFLLVMLPNAAFFLLPKSRLPGNKARSRPALNMIEHGSQAIFVLLLVFVIHEEHSPTVNIYLICMISFLIVYYSLWILYFTNRAKLAALLGLAVFPVLYFMAAEIWLHNWLALIPTAIFGIAHTAITYIGYRPVQAPPHDSV